MADPPDASSDADRERFDALGDLLDQLTLTLDPASTLQRSIEVVAGHLGFDVVWFAEPIDDDLLQVKSIHGHRTDVLRDLAVPKGWGLGGKVFAERRVERIDHYATSRAITHHFDSEVRTEGIRRMMAAPVLSGDELRGVIWGASRSVGAFDDIAAAQLRLAADRTATALAAASRARQLAETAVQNERYDVAVRMHDSVGAMLFAIQAKVRDLANSLAYDAALNAQVEAIERHAMDAAAALRTSIEELSRPPEHLALAAAIRNDCRAFEDRTGIPASLIILDPDLAEIDAARTEALVAAVRGGLLNVEKHADAHSVAVTIARSPEHTIAVSVTDDGGGVPEEPGEGLGLRSMAERLERLGGGLSLDGSDDGGSVLRVWV